MKSTAKKSAGTKTSRPFAIAVAVYVASAIALTVWSYTIDRSILLDRFDKSLATTSLVARSFLHDAQLEDLFLQGGTGGESLKTCRHNLEDLATEYEIPLVGVFEWRNGQVVRLISGMARNDPTAKVGAGIDESIRGHLQSILPTAAQSAKATPYLHTLEDLDQGHVRIALLFVPNKEHEGGLVYVAAESFDFREHLLAIRDIITSFFLLVMVVPLVVLCNRVQRQAAQKLTELNTRLQQDVELQKTREEELKDAIHDLERFNSSAVGRESRIIELKSEVNALLVQLNQQKRYNTDKIA